MSMVDDWEEEAEQCFLSELRRVVNAAKFLPWPHDVKLINGVRDVITDLEKLCE